MPLVKCDSSERGLKLKIANDSQSSTNAAQLRRFNDETWPQNPLDAPRVRYWRAAGQATLLVLLAFSGLQYYFFDVYLTIMAMPRVTLIAGLP
jgi:hypothetical protein